MTRKEQREAAAERYANSIAQHDERKTYCKEDFIAGAEWQKEQLEKNRLEHCDNITEEQYNLETGFINQHLEKYNRMPTFLDAIEYGMQLGREETVEKACEWLYEYCRYGCCEYIEKNDFIEDFRRAMEE